MTFPKIPNKDNPQKIRNLREKLSSDKAKMIFILVVSVLTSIFLVIITRLGEREEPHIVVLAVVGLSFIWTLSGFGTMFRD